MEIEQADSWTPLRRYTAARIALGRAGNSIPTRELLEFQLAHAKARDAVYSQLDLAKLTADLQALDCLVCSVESMASSRAEYIKRPDLGRKLSETSAAQLSQLAAPPLPYDLSVVLADGLSAMAVQEHAVPLLSHLLPQLRKTHWHLAPVTIITGGRVAIGDPIGYLLGVQIVAVLIGERPGLSSPDSLGVYLTYQPKPGLTDESRNCISNIRPEGLPYEAAALKMLYLLTEMRTRRLSGVRLKDEMLPPQLP